MKFELERKFKEERCDIILSKIKEKYFPVYCYMIKKYKTSSQVYDEAYLHSHLNQTLYDALLDFDFDESIVEFNVYLFGKMRDKMVRIVKMLYAQKRYPKGQVYFETKLSENFCYGDLVCEDPKIEYQISTTQSFDYSVSWIKKFLSKDDFKLYMLYINGAKFQEIDKIYKWKLGKSKNKLAYIRKKLREEAKNHPFYQK